MYLLVVFAWIVVCATASKSTVRHLIPRNDSKPAPRTVGYFGNWVCQSDCYSQSATLTHLLIGHLRFHALLYPKHSSKKLDTSDIFLCECQFNYWGGVSYRFSGHTYLDVDN